MAQLSVEVEGDLHATELAIVALMATTTDRERLKQVVEELAVLTDSLFPGVPVERRVHLTARIREKLAFFVARSGG